LSRIFLLNADTKDFNPEYLQILTPDLQTQAIPGILNDTDLVIIDNPSTLHAQGVKTTVKAGYQLKNGFIDLFECTY
jgi:hypothetical protein